MPLRNLGVSELISLGAIEDSDLRHSLDVLFAWLDLQNAKRQRQIVEYLVAEERAGRAHLVKAYSLALDVFEKEDDFDASKSSLVRVEMHRLRESLGRFYKSGGGDAPYVLVLKPGQYRLMATLNRFQTPSATEFEMSPDPESGLSGSAEDRRSPSAQDRAGSQSAAPRRATVWGWRSWASRVSGASQFWLIVLLAAVGISALAYWGYSRFWVAGKAVDSFAPTVAIELETVNPDKEGLLEISQLIEAMNPLRVNVTVSKDPSADYVLHLSEISYENGKSGVEASLYDKKRTLVATENYTKQDNSGSNYEIGKKINTNFFKYGGYLPVDYKINNLYNMNKRLMYSCYYESNGWVSGVSKNIPDYDKTFDCIDPDRVSDPRDKFLFHLMRSSIIANSVSGLIKMSTHFTLSDAQAELDKADQLFPNNKLALGQKIVLEWRNPERDLVKLRRLLERAQEGVMSVELRYDVATTYAYYLGDWEKARNVSSAAGEDQQGLVPSLGHIYHYVEVPEPFVKGDYDAARRALDLTGAKANPTYALFSLAIACARNDSNEIATAVTEMRSIPTAKPETIIAYTMKRRYAPELEKALLTALTSPQCSNITAAS